MVFACTRRSRSSYKPETRMSCQASPIRFLPSIVIIGPGICDLLPVSAGFMLGTLIASAVLASLRAQRGIA
jgi:hypothetical protein